MRVSRRIVQCLALAALVHCFTASTIAQSLLLGPSLHGSPVEPGTSPAPLVDKRTQNGEQLRLAQRKLDTNGATDKATARDVAYYQTRDAVLAQQESVDQRITELEARKKELETQLNSP